MRISDATRAGSNLDLCLIVHQEIERLPERVQFLLPVVICDLEEPTYEQAAGCSAARCRCSAMAWPRADAAARCPGLRGVTATVLCAVTSPTASATAALPVSWTCAAVASATGGPTSTTAASNGPGHDQGAAGGSIPRTHQDGSGRPVRDRGLASRIRVHPGRQKG